MPREGGTRVLCVIRVTATEKFSAAGLLEEPSAKSVRFLLADPGVSRGNLQQKGVPVLLLSKDGYFFRPFLR